MPDLKTWEQELELINTLLDHIEQARKIARTVSYGGPTDDQLRHAQEQAQIIGGQAALQAVRLRRREEDQ